MSPSESQEPVPVVDKERREPADRLIDFVTSLVKREDRGSLAALRKSLGHDFPPAEAMRLLVPLIPPEFNEWKKRCSFQVAALYAFHQEHTEEGNMGDTYRGLGDHESAQKRFIRLLDSMTGNLFPALKQAVGLARAKNVAVNYRQLLKDLFNWDHPKRFVQEQWAFSRWKDTVNEEEVSKDTAASSADSKEE